MKSPELYTIRKFNLKQFLNSDGNLIISQDEEKKYEIKQGGNPLFRQIRIITGDNSTYNKYVIFVDCKGWNYKSKEETDSKVKTGSRELILRDFLRNGISVNGVKYVMSEKSASMSRNSIMGFVAEEIYEELNRRITMDMPIKSTVLAKLLAYRGLFFSGCFCIENFMPNIVIVDDYSVVVKDQDIRYMIDVNKECVNRDGKPYTWKEKGITQGKVDVEINLWDGSGVCTPEIAEYLNNYIGIKGANSFIIRMPYFKGMIHNVDFKKWFRNNNVSTIKDIWGKVHNIEDVDIVVTKSLYKGFKYFKTFGDYRDWELYLQKFKKYDHCFGVTAWNYTFDEEPVYTRASYQILQDLDMEFEDFVTLADYSKEWANKVINGDKVYTSAFLGLLADNHKASNYYMKAILKNQEMMKEEGVRAYIISLINKKIDEMKCGKLYLKGAFKFIVIDLVMFLRYISGMEVKGELNNSQFYAVDKSGAIKGRRIIERNPHISASEHCILEGTETELLNEYCGHLANVFICNGYSITLPRLNGCDEDGDRVFLIDSETMMKGINVNKPVVLDLEDKITAKEKDIELENIIDSNIDSMVSLVGEFSNYATCYHNKVARTQQQKQKYEDFVAILSIATGKSIDYAKTGVLFMPPHNIQKFAKPYPYFMKYASDYYYNLKSFSKAFSNMNQLCFDIEKFHKQHRFKRKFKDFDYKIMMSRELTAEDEPMIEKMQEIYKEFNAEVRRLRGLQKNNEDIKDEWNDFYKKYKKRVRKEITEDVGELANIAVEMLYGRNPKKEKKFIWIIAGDGVVENLKATEIELPIRCEDGEFEYLEKKYNIERMVCSDV